MTIDMMELVIWPRMNQNPRQCDEWKVDRDVKAENKVMVEGKVGWPVLR